MAATIRSARPGEAGDLLPAYEWLFAPPGSRPRQWDPAVATAALDEAVAADDADVLVAELEGEIVGLCTVYRDLRSVRFGPRAWVEDLAVHPDRRSRGIGKGLLDAAMDWARAHGASHLELDSSTTRTNAHRFYEREKPHRRSECFGWEL